MSFVLTALSVNPPIAAIGPAPPLAVLSVLPSNGDFAGGTPVTISGTSFFGTATVTIGGHACTGVTVVNSTTITATTGAGLVADVGVAKNVVVTTSLGSATGVGLFTYTAWFQAVQIGGVNPALFADFTTEGVSNHYLFNGAVFSSEAAWLTAISGTFSRGSTGFFTNSSGLLASVGNNVIRFDFDPVALTSRGILLEGASTNSILQSNTFTSTWNIGSVSSIVQNATGPDGTTSAWTLTSAGGDGGCLIFQSIAMGSAGGNISAFVKPGTDSFFYIQVSDGGGGSTITSFNLSSVTVGTQNHTLAGAPTVTLTGGSITQAAGGFLRVSTNWTGSGGNLIGVGFADADASRVSTVNRTGFLFGCQSESALLPSSYIPTTTGAVTRSADSLTGTPISSWYNTTKGVFLGNVIRIGPIGDSTEGGIVSISDGSASNRADLRSNVVAADTIANVVSGGSTSFIVHGNDAGQSPYAINTLRKAAMSLQASNFIYVANAGTPATSASGATPVSPSQMEIGGITLAGNSNPLFGNVLQVGYWPVTATAAQLQSLTT